MPYRITAEAIAPRMIYFSPASLDRSSFRKPASTYWEMLVSSSATKIRIRSRAPASSIMPVVANSSSVQNSP